MHDAIKPSNYYFWLFSACEKNASMRLITKLATGLQGVASKWFEIATLLGIPVDKLNTFKQECEGSTEACLNEVIKVCKSIKQ